MIKSNVSFSIYFHLLFPKMQMSSKVGFFFNHKEENRRAIFYLLTPTSIAVLIVITPVFGIEYSDKEYIMQRYGARFLRSLGCIAVLMSSSIFIRSLYMRFAAINTLLRFCFYLLFWLWLTRCVNIVFQPSSFVNEHTFLPFSFQLK